MTNYKDIEAAVNYLINLNLEGEAGAAFRASIVNDFIEAGYTVGRAEQVVDELISWARRAAAKE